MLTASISTTPWNSGCHKRIEVEDEEQIADGAERQRTEDRADGAARARP